MRREFEQKFAKGTKASCQRLLDRVRIEFNQLLSFSRDGITFPKTCQSTPVPPCPRERSQPAACKASLAGRRQPHSVWPASHRVVVELRSRSRQRRQRPPSASADGCVPIPIPAAPAATAGTPFRPPLSGSCSLRRNCAGGRFEPLVARSVCFSNRDMKNRRCSAARFAHDRATVGTRLRYLRVLL